MAWQVLDHIRLKNFNTFRMNLCSEISALRPLLIITLFISIIYFRRAARIDTRHQDYVVDTQQASELLIDLWPNTHLYRSGEVLYGHYCKRFTFLAGISLYLLNDTR